MTLERIACYIMLAHAFFLPLSTSITGGLFFILAIIWCVDKNAYERWKFYFSYSLTMPILFLIAVSIAGIVYSTGSWEASFRSANQILRLSIIPVLAYYLNSKHQQKQFVLIAFVTAVMVTILATYLKVYANITIGHRTYENNIFKNHIVMSYFVAITMFIICVWLEQFQQYKKYLIPLMGITLFYLVFLNTGRIGYIILYICLTIWAWHKYKFKGVGVTLLALSLMMVLAYNFSAPFSMRLNQLYTECQMYSEGNGISPMGARLDFIINSIQLVLQHPVLGTGTGSFMEAYKTAFSSQSTVLTDNPHNQYLNNAVELGMLGVFALVWLFLKQWKLIQHSLSGTTRILAQGIFLSFFIGCFFNSWIKNFTECHFYCLMTAYFIPIRIAERFPLFAYSFSKQKSANE